MFDFWVGFIGFVLVDRCLLLRVLVLYLELDFGHVVEIPVWGSIGCCIVEFVSLRV